MVLLAGQAYDNIVGVSTGQLATMSRITPGQPDNSHLVHNIQGTQASVSGSGDRMPLRLAPLVAIDDRADTTMGHGGCTGQPAVVCAADGPSHEVFDR